MNATLEIPAVTRSTGRTPTSSPDAACGLPAADVRAEPQSITKLDFLLAQQDAVQRRSKMHLRHLWLSIGLPLAVLVAVLVIVIYGPVPQPWWVGGVAGIIAASWRARASWEQVRFFQSQYSDDQHDLKLLRQQIVEAIDALSRENNSAPK